MKALLLKGLSAYGATTLFIDEAAAAFTRRGVDARIVGDTAVTNVLAQVRGVAASQPFDVRLRYTRAWVRTEEGWVVVAAHASTASI